MEPRPEAGLPATLGRWVGEIVLSIPQPARRTVAELIVGGLLAGGGHVTQAFLALTPRLGWQAYHWMLEHGRFRLLGLIAALCRIVRREIGQRLLRDNQNTSSSDNLAYIRWWSSVRRASWCQARSRQRRGPKGPGFTLA